MTNPTDNHKHLRRITVLAGVIVAALLLCGTGAATAQSVTNLNGLAVLDLATARKIALEHQPTLREARYRAETALARVGMARAGLMPTVSISAGISRYDPADSGSFSSPLTGTAPGSAAPSAYSPEAETWYQAGARATWLIFSGFQRSAAHAAAVFGYEESEAARTEAERLILHTVTAAYLHAQSARAQMEIAKKDADFNQRLLDDAIASRKAGRGSLGDELNFRVRANAARSTVIFAKRELRLARIGLAALMGLPDARLPQNLQLAPLQKPSQAETTLPNLNSEEQQMQNSRPDLRMARAALSRREKELTVAKGGFYPKVGLSASYDGRRTDDFSFSGDDFSTSAGITLSYDIFAGGINRAKTREAKAAVSQEEARYSHTEINARQELLNAYEQLKSAIEYLELQNENLGYAEQNRNLIEKSYNAGQAPIVRLNEAQKDLVAARVRQTQAVIALLRARNDLSAATGRILSEQ